MNNKETKRMKCWNCGYEWNTRSNKIYVSCPSCLQKVLSKRLDKEGRKETIKEIKQKILDLNNDDIQELKIYIRDILEMDRYRDDVYNN